MAKKEVTSSLSKRKASLLFPFILPKKRSMAGRVLSSFPCPLQYAGQYPDGVE